MDDAAAFARLITALRPWLGELVVVGGWAHRLHRMHPRARPPSHLPLTTVDADLAFGADARLAGNLRAALAEVGFREELFGDHTPPVTHYRLEQRAGFYVEFLTPLRGSGVKRSGAPDATLSRSGVTAQKMRYLDVLLLAPWTIRIEATEGVLATTTADVLVPNPTSFIVQKLLMHTDRTDAKRAQDILYIHDTLQLFGPSLGALQELWEGRVRPAMAARTARRVQSIARRVFSSVTDTLREAARIPQDRHLTPENVRAACEFGLARILDIVTSG